MLVALVGRVRIEYSFDAVGNGFRTTLKDMHSLMTSIVADAKAGVAISHDIVIPQLLSSEARLRFTDFDHRMLSETIHVL